MDLKHYKNKINALKKMHDTDAFLLIKGVYMWHEISEELADDFMDRFANSDSLFYTEEFQIESYQKFLLNTVNLFIEGLAL